MPIFVALSCAGGANGNLLTTSRIFFVSAREGHLPLIMAGVSTTCITPLPAVMIMVYQNIYLHYVETTTKEDTMNELSESYKYHVKIKLTLVVELVCKLPRGYFIWQCRDQQLSRGCSVRLNLIGLGFT